MRFSRTTVFVFTTLYGTLVGCGSREQAPAAQTSAAPQAPGSPASGSQPGAPAGDTRSSVRSAATIAATGCPAKDVAAFALPGTVHDESIEGVETWTLAGSPHRLPDGALIHANAIVTIEPCARVIVGDGRTIRVESGGTLIANGDAEHPIVFDSASVTPARGVWAGIEFQTDSRATSTLRGVTIEEAGGDPGMPAALVIRDGVTLDVQHVRIVRSKRHGVLVDNTGRFAPSSTDLTVTESGTAEEPTTAVFFGRANAVGSLPDGRYDGNVVNEIGVDLAEVEANATWRNPGVGVRYRLQNGLIVEGQNGAVLTIAPGTTIAFAPETTLWVGRGGDGGLVADGGSDASRVVLTSARSTPEAGDWGGVFFGDHLARGATKLAFVTIAFAGRADGSDDIGCGEPSGAAVTIADRDLGPRIEHLRVENLDPASVGIARAFNAATATDYTAATLGNELGGGGRCRQTLNRDADGNCPDPVPACR